MAEIVGKRLEDLIKERGTDQSKLARKLGISQPTIGRLISGETRETGKLLEIARELETSPEYLVGMTDDPAPMTVRQVMVFEGASDVGMRDNSPEMVAIAKIDLRYGLGGTYVDGPVETEMMNFPRDWIRAITTAPPSMLVWTEGDGDSMEPTIRSREPILIDRSQTTPRMADGIWAFAWGDVGGVKRLRPLPDGTVKILSDNPSVPEDFAADGELHIIGRVVGVVKRL